MSLTLSSRLRVNDFLLNKRCRKGDKTILECPLSLDAEENFLI